MSEDKGLKSSLELAMERLKKRDEEAGIERKPITDAQKAEIAEVRRTYDAKMAELDLKRQETQGHLSLIADPAVMQAQNDEYRHDRERLASERDRKIEKIRERD